MECLTDHGSGSNDGCEGTCSICGDCCAGAERADRRAYRQALEYELAAARQQMRKVQDALAQLEGGVFTSKSLNPTWRAGVAEAVRFVREKAMLERHGAAG